MDVLADNNQTWLLLKTTTNAIEGLAMENSLIRYLPQYNHNHLHSFSQILHWYPIQQPTVLLGAKDTRLTNFFEAYHFLLEQGYQVVIRPHGGTAIVCDEGVINVSWVRDLSQQTISIEQAYLDFIALVKHFLFSYNIALESYEMPHSYCPGKFDLIVQQRKIGGTAQKRFKHGVTTSAYVSVHGNQTRRSELLKEFYHIGQADDTYPQIHPQSMSQLQAFFKNPIQVSDVYDRAEEILQSRSKVSSLDLSENPLLSSIYTNQHSIFKQRQRHLLDQL